MDRSGSMEDCRQDAEAGLNEFISRQKALPGECTFTLVQFDTEYEFVYRAVPLQKISGRCRLVPRGGTALLDALGRAISQTGGRLSLAPEGQRPGLVVFVIVTDGKENASTEYTRSDISRLIRFHSDVHRWQFTFLGANIDSFAEGSDLGIAPASCADFAGGSSSFALMAASDNVGRMRYAAMTGEHVICGYTDEERTAMYE
jgi:hypothetical protein